MPGGEAADPEAWDHLRARLHRRRWNVYAKRPFGGAEHVIRYLGRTIDAAAWLPVTWG